MAGGAGTLSRDRVSRRSLPRSALLNDDVGMAAVDEVEVGRSSVSGAENRDNYYKAQCAQPESVHRHAFLMWTLAPHRRYSVAVRWEKIKHAHAGQAFELS